MTRERSEFDILERILQERLSRNWTEYMLAQRAGLPQSTISTWYRKDMQPSVASLEKICNAFHISLSQFFADYQGSPSTVLNSDQKQLLTVWDQLTEEQRQAVFHMLKSFVKERGERVR